MDEEHFVATLQATYFGDKNAFNLCLKEYRNLKQALNEIKEYINTNKIINNEDGTFLLKECYYGQEILEKIDKVLGEENVNITN